MTDRELLELAAKAAEIEIGWKDDISYTGMGSFMPIFWNPLVRDGDALRLAVKLGMRVEANARTACAVVLSPMMEPFAFEPVGTDPYAATRRAIVRAAAEIGKGMQ